MIYFITQENDTLVKVGYAESVRDRMAQLQTGNPYTLRVYATMHGDQSREAWVHSLIKEHHVRGEWYVFNDDIKNKISELSETYRNPITGEQGAMMHAHVVEFVEEHSLWSDA